MARATIDWIHAHVGHESEACLIWPFSCRRGYAQICTRTNGKPKASFAHRLMCELAHGPAPSPDYEAAHSCGMGHRGCMNPKHLSWKTRTDNQRDRVRDGTTSGRPMGGYKLTPEKVAEIRARQSHETVTSLAARFGVTRSCIRQIHLRKTWPIDGAYSGFGSGSILRGSR